MDMINKLKVCQTCLCKDRHLYPLARLKNSLIGFNIKLNMEGGVCWECKRRIIRYHQFRQQAKRAQKTLRCSKKFESIQPLSTLTATKRIFYYTHEDPATHTSITCHETGPIMIKQEFESSYDNQGADTGYVQIITKDRIDDNVVYEIEDHIDDEGHEWYNNDDSDNDDNEDWTCETNYYNTSEDFNEQVQRHIVTMERERQMNAKDNDGDNRAMNQKDSFSRSKIDDLIENIKIFASQGSENLEDQLTRNVIVKVQDKKKNDKSKERKFSDEVTEKTNEIVRWEHNYCQSDFVSQENVESHVIDDYSISELPRITMVESIQDQPTVSAKEPVDFTEIIELNISIPFPDSSGSGDSTTTGNVSNVETENITDYTHNTNDSMDISTVRNKLPKHCVESSKHITDNRNILHSSSMNTTKNDRTLTKTGCDINISSNSDINRDGSDKNINKVNIRKDSNITKATTSRTESSPKKTKNATASNVTETNSYNYNVTNNKNVIFIGSRSPSKPLPVTNNRSNDTEITSIVINDKKDKDGKTTSKNKPQTSNNNAQSPGTSKQNECNNLTSKELNSEDVLSQIDALINKELSRKKTGSQVVENNNKKDGSESVNATNAVPKSKEKDTITVKVKYLAKPPCDTQSVRIKSEPVSDEEDCIINDEPSIDISQMTTSTLPLKEDNVSNTIDEDKLEQELWKRSILLVYNRLRAHKYASTFSHAVSDTIAPDYSKIVKRPMHLPGIRRNVLNGTVRTTSEFHRDLLLMLTNALMYNSSDTSVYHMTKDFLEEAKYQLDVLRTVHDESTLPSDATTPRPRSKRRQDLEQKEAKRSRMIETLIVPKIEKPDKKSKSKSKILPNPLSASRRVKNEVEVEKKKRGRKKREKIPVEVKTEKIKAEVKKVSENCLLIGSKIVPVPDSSDTDDVHIISTRRVSKLNDKYFSSDYCTTSKSNIDVKPKISELVTPVKRRGRPPKHAKKDVKDEIITSTVKRTGRRGKQDVSVRERFEELSKLPNLSPIVKLEPISVEPKKEKQDISNQDTSDNADTLDDYCVAITTEPQRDLTLDEASSLKKVLEEKILQIALDLSKFAPRFRGKPIIADGVVKLWCEDAPSLKWLKKTVSELKGGFIVKKQTDLPKKIKCAILIPGSNGDMVVTEKILAAQNPWAQVGSWAFYSSEQRGESMILVIGIPSTLIPVIMSHQRRLAYILGSVHVKFYNSEGKLTDSPTET